jgi:hypothetical protein
MLAIKCEHVNTQTSCDIITRIHVAQPQTTPHGYNSENTVFMSG